MIINFNDIQALQLQCNIPNEEYIRPAGIEHYKLLSYLSKQINNAIIFDIGTHKGFSALALSHNKNNTVYTFDLYDKINEEDKKNLWSNNNVKFSTDNLMDDLTRNKWKDLILNSSIIFIDIDPHEGTEEYKFYLWLKENKYKGLLILDDIFYFKEMRDNIWHKIPNIEKYDLTRFGHWSGTGFVVFNGQKIELIDQIPERIPKFSNEQKSWTIVTAYFNLTKTFDASNEIKERDQTYYMKNANMTMAIDQNLVVFCDKDSEIYLKSLRPEYLKNKTKFIILDFMDIDIVKNNYNKLVNIRKKTRYNTDPRNTPSYYLLCMARYDLLLKTINDNPFNSTHFAWCNICIERMSWKNEIYFPKIWQEFRDKFSTCYIDYQPKSLVIDNIQEYYKWGRCGMCSGFFTGNKYYMSTFCNFIIKAFDDMLNQEVGHADEQLYSIVYFRHPEIFEFYYGDYQEMIINYGWIYDKPEEPVRNIIRNLDNSDENYKLLKDVTNRWLQSYNLGCFTSNQNTYDYVKNINNKATNNCKYLF
jgi:hypothetical protein